MAAMVVAAAVVVVVAVVVVLVVAVVVALLESLGVVAMLRPAVVVTVTVVPVMAPVVVVVVVVVLVLAVRTNGTGIHLFETETARTANHMGVRFLERGPGSTARSHCRSHGMRRHCLSHCLSLSHEASVLREQGLVQCVRSGSCLSQNGYGDR